MTTYEKKVVEAAKQMTRHFWKTNAPVGPHVWQVMQAVDTLREMNAPMKKAVKKP